MKFNETKFYEWMTNDEKNGNNALVALIITGLVAAGLGILIFWLVTKNKNSINVIK